MFKYRQYCVTILTLHTSVTHVQVQAILCHYFDTRYKCHWCLSIAKIGPCHEYFMGKETVPVHALKPGTAVGASVPNRQPKSVTDIPKIAAREEVTIIGSTLRTPDPRNPVSRVSASQLEGFLPGCFSERPHLLVARTWMREFLEGNDCSVTQGVADGRRLTCLWWLWQMALVGRSWFCLISF